MQILIVEDVDSMRLLIQELLEGIPGIQVSGLASNVWEARLELTRRKPDLILLDEVLPGESSLDFLEEAMREKVQVVLITGLETPPSELPPGALSRIKKPTWETLEGDRRRFEKIIIDQSR